MKDLIFFFLSLPSVGLGKGKNALAGRARRKRISFFPLAFPKLRISYEEIEHIEDHKMWKKSQKSSVCPVRTTTLRTLRTEDQKMRKLPNQAVRISY